jgi:putative PIN family toxin of toxin-antitoxin system
MKVETHLRLVIDTNVWISAALIPTGTPAKLVHHVLAHGVPVLTPQTFEELRTRLHKPKFDRYISLDQRHALLRDLQACALWVEVPIAISEQTFSRDPDDDAFVHAALAGQAHWLVTGDADLLSVTQPLPFTIATPAVALGRALSDGASA